MCRKSSSPSIPGGGKIDRSLRATQPADPPILLCRERRDGKAVSLAKNNQISQFRIGAERFQRHQLLEILRPLHIDELPDGFLTRGFRIEVIISRVELRGIR